MHRFIPAALLLAALPALAGEGLYDAAPPEGSAFVRVFNGTASPSGAVDLAGRKLGGVKPISASSYLIVEKGRRALTIGDQGLSVDVAAGNFYTLSLLPGEDEPLVIQDKPNTNLARARITLYNLSEGTDVDLRLADGSQDVISDVAPRGTGERLVNPMAVDLAVYSDGAELSALPGLSLERGGSYSVFVSGGPEGARAVWVADSTRGP